MSKEVVAEVIALIELGLIAPEDIVKCLRKANSEPEKALAEQPAQQEPVAWPIETNNQVEGLAKQCGWDNRRYMTPADYQIWCDRMRQFVQLAHPPAQRTWVGLEAEDRLCAKYMQDAPDGIEAVIDYIEAKLKEKNT